MHTSSQGCLPADLIIRTLCLETNVTIFRDKIRKYETKSISSSLPSSSQSYNFFVSKPIFECASFCFVVFVFVFVLGFVLFLFVCLFVLFCFVLFGLAGGGGGGGFRGIASPRVNTVNSLV